MDEPAEEDDDPRSTGTSWGRFAAVGLAVGIGRAALAVAGESIVEATGLSARSVGALLLGVINALPETVTAIAAVRRNALTLAIAAILGGLLVRQGRGPGRVGFEGVALLGIYASIITVLSV